MVETDIFRQAFYSDGPSSRVTREDVLAIVEGGVSAAMERLDGMDLLPPYRREARERLMLWRGAGAITQDAYESAHARVTSISDDEDRARSLQTLASLVRVAFATCDALQNPEEGPAHQRRASDLLRVSCDPSGEGLVDWHATFEVPSCSYLQFLADACESLGREPVCCPCHVRPSDPSDDVSPLVGWLGCQGAAVVELSAAGMPEGERGHELFLRTLLKFLLDAGLHDARMLTHDVAKPALTALHATSAVWLQLREDMDYGRMGTCRVCGRPFVATNERRLKTRYCSKNGTCARTFARVRHIVERTRDGMGVEEAVAAEAGIGRERFLDIVRRNENLLAIEYQGVDFARMLADEDERRDSGTRG